MSENFKHRWQRLSFTNRHWRVPDIDNYSKHISSWSGLNFLHHSFMEGREQVMQYIKWILVDWNQMKLFAVTIPMVWIHLSDSYSFARWGKERKRGKRKKVISGTVTKEHSDFRCVVFFFLNQGIWLAWRGLSWWSSGWDCTLNAGDTGFIPGQGTKTPYATTKDPMYHN